MLLGQAVVLAIPLLPLILGLSRKTVAASVFGKKREKEMAVESFEPWGSRIRFFYLAWGILVIILLGAVKQ